MPLGKLTPYYHGRSRKRLDYIYTDENGRFVVSVQRNRKRRRRLCRDLAEARYWAENVGLLFKDSKADPNTMLLSDLCERYAPEDERDNPKSSKLHRAQEETIIRIVGNLPIAEIRRQHIEQYKTIRSQEPHQRRKGTVGPATVNSETARFHRLLELAVRDGLLPYNPLRGYRKLKEPPGRNRWLREDEEERLREVCDEEFWRLIEIGMLSGMRQGEQLGCRRDQIEWEINCIHLPTTKGGKGRFVPMGPRLQELVRDQLAIGTPWLCPNRTRSNRWQQRNFYRQFCKYLDRAGIEDLTWHDLRHTYATRLRMRGVDIADIRDLLGHSDIRMTSRYSHHYREHLKNAVELLENGGSDDTGDDTGASKRRG